MKLEHSNFIIFSILSILCFWPPLQLYFKPVFDIWDVLELSHDFKRAYIWLFLSPTNLYYLLVKLEDSNFTIFFNIADYVFWPPSASFWSHFWPFRRPGAKSILQKGIYLIVFVCYQYSNMIERKSLRSGLPNIKKSGLELTTLLLSLFHDLVIFQFR